MIKQFAGLAQKYLDSLDDQPVFPNATQVKGLEALDLPLPKIGMPAEAVLNLLGRHGSPATVKSSGGRYFGFVTGGSLPAALGANLLATVWDQNVALNVMSPVAAQLETTTGRWLLELLGLPETSGYGFVTGDTMANFCGMAAARHALLARAGWDVEAEGLFHAPRIRVLVSEEAHVTVFKALSLLGFGRGHITKVPVDEQGRIRPALLKVSDEPTLICAQLGNVNTGACDDIAAICAHRGLNTWVHVDGAFGLWAAASAETSPLVKGAALADSWATDGHKWLNVPYDCGFVFARDKGSLSNAMSLTGAGYLPIETAREPCHYTPEMSRFARAVPVWAALMTLGKHGIQEMIERHCRQARRFAEGLAAAGFYILNDVVLNQVLVSFGDDDRTRLVIAAIQEEGTCWCGGTVWQGRAAMRISVSSWATTDEDVERSMEVMIRLAGSR